MGGVSRNVDVEIVSTDQPKYGGGIRFPPVPSLVPPIVDGICIQIHVLFSKTRDIVYRDQ